MVSGINRVLSGGLHPPLQAGDKKGLSENPIYILLGGSSQGANSREQYFPDMRFSPLSLETPTLYNTPPQQTSFQLPVGQSVFNSYPSEYPFMQENEFAKKGNSTILPSNTWAYGDNGDILRGSQSNENSIYDDSEQPEFSNLNVFGEAIF